MTISIWRYSHLTLAILSFLLLTIASVTGVILAFKPVQEKLQPYGVDQFSKITLAETLPKLRQAYPDLSELTVDANKFVLIKGNDAEGNKIEAYVDPRTGKIIGHPKPESVFFQWVTAFHRSLFIHETGRFLIGITSFLLLLITISGTMLIIQRQRGVKRFFQKIARDNFAQFYHVVLGRLSLIPIIIIALSGTYLSLERFQLIGTPISPAKVDFDSIKDEPEIQAKDFPIFKQTKLAEVDVVEFPFSTDVEDYFTIKLKTKALTVNQVTGDVLSQTIYPTSTTLTNWSLDLHTGRGNIIWAIILAVASANILFFIYSGFAITWRRIAGRSKNKFKADEAEIVILIGSENGNTFTFAKAVHQALLKEGKKSIMLEMNKYGIFPKAEHIIIFTATYGLGDPPTNAKKFASLLKSFPQTQEVNFSVLGFGSHAYPDFCKFAFDVHQMLSLQSWATPITDIHTVNDRSPQEFTLWSEIWSQNSQISLSAMPEFNLGRSQTRSHFTVVEHFTSENEEGTFVLHLKPKNRIKIRSGDLLAIYPRNDHRERLYSVGVTNKQVRLSVRLHPNGLGSNYLHQLRIGDRVAARVVNNPHFHFPEQAKGLILIANGTGIAPFIGIIDENRLLKPITLYCGFRNQYSYSLHQTQITQFQAAQKLDRFLVAFSREENKQYVSELIAKDADFITKQLESGSVVMICGSLAMEKDVMDLLAATCTSINGKELAYYQSRGQILTDCY